MTSLILSVATRYLLPLQLLFSILLLLRGHNEPGGGFVGGLVAAAAFALYAITFGVEEARRLLRFPPRTLIAIGLLSAVGSGLMGLFAGKPLMTGLWIRGALSAGTPLLFDTGVYLVVIGFTLTIFFALAET